VPLAGPTCIDPEEEVMIATCCKPFPTATGLEPRPSADSRERRIRAIVGSPSRGALPRVNPQSLARYYDYLRRHLSFPFAAHFHEESGPERGAVRHVTVTGLMDPVFTPSAVLTGILCRARLPQREITVPLAELELDEEDPNARLIDDYWYWVWNWS
jgi:hypothetical protein